MATLTSLEQADVLTDVLQTLQLRGRVFCCSALSAPWAMRLPTSEYAHFHVIERGSAWLQLSDEMQPRPLASGDFVLVPHGRGHVLSDHPKPRAKPLAQLLKSAVNGKLSSHHVMEFGGSGARMQMICGSFQFDNEATSPLRLILPPLIHLKHEQSRLSEWLEPTLKMLALEARHPRPGSETLISRLLDIIFVQALRAWITSEPQESGGWLGALRDPQIGTALGLMHREPERGWSVEALAKAVAMSRSPFAARFSALVGEPPLTYLTNWRMHLAATLLTREGLNVGQVAGRVGYDSEAAFSKAFKRRFGQSPLAHRQQEHLPPTFRSEARLLGQ
jgi:AraC-like DNA-binding protein